MPWLNLLKGLKLTFYVSVLLEVVSGSTVLSLLRA